MKLGEVRCAPRLTKLQLLIPLLCFPKKCFPGASFALGFVCTCVCLCKGVCTGPASVHACLCMCSQAYAYGCENAYTHICVCVCMRLCARVCVHLYASVTCAVFYTQHSFHCLLTLLCTATLSHTHMCVQAQNVGTRSATGLCPPCSETRFLACLHLLLPGLFSQGPSPLY